MNGSTSRSGILGLCLLLAITRITSADVSPALPDIPNHTFNLKDFGGVGDGKTWNTEAFQKAIAAINDAGGGRLTVPEGTYLTRQITLCSKLDLHLDSGAVIQAPPDIYRCRPARA